MTIGIYKLVNTITGKVYVGSSVDIEKRKKAHINTLRRGKHENRKMQKDAAVYGVDVFLCEILEELSHDNNLLSERERYWTEYFYDNNQEGCYNPSYAIKHTSRQRAKHLYLDLTEIEFIQLKHLARRTGMTMSEYVRSRLF